MIVNKELAKNKVITSHRKPGREPVLPLHSRDLIGDAGAKLGGDAFSIDDAGRHLNPCPLALVLCPGPLPDPLIRA